MEPHDTYPQGKFVYSSREANWFVDAARRTVAADSTAARAGLFNSNVPVRDPVTGEWRNVRTPLPIGEREPIAWRTAYLESEVYTALRTRFDNIPTTLYAADDGSVLIQRHETDVRPFPPRGEAIAPELADQLADAWRDLQDIPLPPPTGAMPPDYVRYVRAQLGREAPVAVPRTDQGYRALHLSELDAAARVHYLHWSGFLHALGFPRDPVAPARAAVARMGPVPLRPAHPDMHPSNLGTKNGRLWLWDPELVGWHDPHHTLTMMLVWGRYPPAQQQAIVDRAHDRAIPAVSANLRRNVALWRRFVAVFDAVKQAGRLANTCAGLPTEQARRHAHESAQWLADRVNPAVRLWGGEPLDESTMRHAVETHVLPVIEQRRSFGAAALGFGVKWSGPKPFDIPRGHAQRHSPHTALHQFPQAGGYGLSKHHTAGR
ncbi:hypothetical protein LO772_32170 [Yinghuangia sp. ASG 101]|uniref:phosphotransferase family protein n=1 Tax=Yinghuangia sp. ASG 101 TaxID=2896848 RepID=UPI001E30E5D4|nr:hypothetical protein [Yinghuangia sp. ASG 101]UGQ11399.1 hypothetical protein LO772_32170 [Yinghuangia sp. ASG 101]